jgi:NADPH:quinone reductase-like Zn-dependent oxidoreductase
MEAADKKNVKVVVKSTFRKPEDNLAIEVAEIPRPDQEDDVLVKLFLRPVNPSDVAMLAGVHKPVHIFDLHCSKFTWDL